MNQINAKDLLPIVGEHFKIEPGLVTMSASAMNCLQVCPRKFRYEYLQGLKPCGQSPALVFGSTWHRLVEVHHAGGDDETAMDEATKVWVAGGVEPDDKRNLDRLRIMFRDYKKKWADRELKVISANGMQTEMAFTVPTNNLHVMLMGKLDMLIDRQPYGIMVVDHKTASRLESICVNPNLQFSGYIWAAMQHFDKVFGLLVNGALVAKTMTRFEEYVTTRGAGDLREFEAELVRAGKFVLAEVEEEKRRTLLSLSIDGLWPKHTHSCSGFGSCPYKVLCTSREDFVDQDISEVIFERR